MKRIACTLLIVAVTLVPAMAQKIETQTNDRTRILHLKTALNHLTVIEVGEPVVEVAAGSPAFKVEWRDNKVFVQPTEADASTNLFIWTATQRLNYELEPAGAVSSMDFAVDQRPVPSPEPVKPAAIKLHPASSPSIADFLLASKPVRMLPSRQHPGKPVEVSIRDLYEKDGHLLIRYAIRNQTAQTYTLDTPQVYELDGVQSYQSLYGFINAQLGDEQIDRLKVKQETPLKVLNGQAQSEQIAPGEEAVGVVALQMTASSSPEVLRLDFPSVGSSAGTTTQSKQRPVSAYLVR
jgi:hypothetical protein